MLETTATLLVALAGIYAAIGVLVGLAFVVSGAGRVDSAAAKGSWGFRVLIFPGSLALWPLVLRKWIQAARSQR